MIILDKAIAPPAVGRFWLAAKIAMLLGVLSIAAVAAIAAPRIDCRGSALLTDHSGSYLLTDTGGGHLLIDDERECRVVTSGNVAPRATPWVTIPASVARYLPPLD